MNSLDIITTFASIFVILFVGLYFSSKRQTEETFSVAKRSMSGFVLALSIFGTYFSNITFLINPCRAYNSNWKYFATNFSLIISAYLAIRYFLPIYRKKKYISAYSHFKEKFGTFVSTYAASIVMFFHIFRVGIIIFLLSLVLKNFFGSNELLFIFLVGFVVTLYTYLGGIEAVIWTDVIQTGIFVLGGLFALFLLITKIPGGVMGIIDVGNKYQKFSMGPYDLSVFKETFLLLFLSGFFALKDFGIDQTFVQRYESAKSDKDAKAALWGSTLFCLFIAPLFLFIGTALFVFYQIYPDRLPGGLRTEEILPFFILNEFPVGLRGVMVSALLAAAMSSIDSSINSTATLFLEHYYKIFSKNRQSRSSIRVLHLASIGIGLLGVGIAVSMLYVDNVFELWFSIAGGVAGGLLGIFVLGLFFKKQTSPFLGQIGVFVSLLVGGLILTPLKLEIFRLGWISDFHPYILPVLLTVVTIIVGCLWEAAFRIYGCISTVSKNCKR